MRIERLDGPLMRGKAERLFVLDYGTFDVTSATPPRRIGIVGFLVGTDAGDWALFDTGFPPEYATDAGAASARDGLGAFGEVVSLTPENLPEAQIRRAGIAPSDITVMVQTHTHIDHWGGMGGFPGLGDVPVVIGGAERAMERPAPGFGAPGEWPDMDWRTLEGDADLCEGLTLLPSPGHAPGQIAALVTLPETGAVLLTCDAASRPAEVLEGFSTSLDPEAARASAARLMGIAAETDAWILWGHDPGQWRVIRKAPESYG